MFFKKKDEGPKIVGGVQIEAAATTQESRKNKEAQYIGFVVLTILLVGGGWYYFETGMKKPKVDEIASIEGNITNERQRTGEMKQKSNEVHELVDLNDVYVEKWEEALPMFFKDNWDIQDNFFGAINTSCQIAGLTCQLLAVEWEEKGREEIPDQWEIPRVTEVFGPGSYNFGSVGPHIEGDMLINKLPFVMAAAGTYDKVQRLPSVLNREGEYFLGAYQLAMQFYQSGTSGFSIRPVGTWEAAVIEGSAYYLSEDGRANTDPRSFIPDSGGNTTSTGGGNSGGGAGEMGRGFAPGGG